MPTPSPASWGSPTAWCANTWYEPCSSAAHRWTSSAMTNFNTPSRDDTPPMANVPPSGAMEDDPIHVAAAEWLVRLQESDLSLHETLAWQGWLNEDPRHAHAFARMEEVSQVLRSVPAPPAVSERL